MEPGHDDEIMNPSMDNRLCQPGRTRLPPINFKLEGDKANEGNNVCENVIFLNIYEVVGN